MTISASEASDGEFEIRIARGWIGAHMRRWFIGLGVICIVLGLIACANLAMATMAAVYVIATLLLAVGISMLIHAFGVGRSPWMPLMLFLGALNVAGAAFMAYDLTMATLLLTFWLAVLLITSGVVRISIALWRRFAGWPWFAGAGLFGIAAGGIITSGWPADAVWVPGLILSVDLLVQGAALILIGSTLGQPATIEPRLQL